MFQVEPDLSSIFARHTQQQQHSNSTHRVMEWSSEGGQGLGHAQVQGQGMMNRSMNHNEEAAPFVSPNDMYHPYNLSPQSPFDMSDYVQHGVKIEQHQHHRNSADFEYLDVGPYSQQQQQQQQQVVSISGSHQDFMTSASSYMPQPSSVPLPSYGNQPVSGVAGGVLEEIDGILKNFDMPIQQQQGLVMDPLFGEHLISLPQQGGCYNGHSGLGPVVPDYSQLISMEDTQAVEDLAKSLHVEIMSENSQPMSALDTCSMSSENSPFIYGSASQAAMHSGYLDARGGTPMRWPQQQGNGMNLQNSGQMVVKAPPISVAPHGGFGSYHVEQQPYHFSCPRPPSYPTNPNLIPCSLGQPQMQPHADNGRLNLNGHFVLDGSAITSSQPAMPATGLELVHLLLECAEAVAEDNLQLAKVILGRLKGHVLPDGNPMQRLAAYFEQALRARLTRENYSPIFKGLTGDKSIPATEILEAFSVFYDCLPIGKFGHLTSNQILLDAVDKERMVHVLDLQLWHGMQWPAFLQALAFRPGGAPILRMTAMGSSLKDLQETGEKLLECAKNLSVPFEFCPLIMDLEHFEPSMVEIRPGEVLVVNSFVQFHCLLNRGADLLNRVLRGLRVLNPRVLAFAENDANHNSPSFLTRFVECLRYYSAVFDAFDASLPHDSPARMKMERIFAAQKIRNIIACEGPARVDGHETMRYWHKRMEAANFTNKPLSSRAVSQAHLLLNLYYSNGYTLSDVDCGYLALGWHGMPLMGVSAWY